MEIPGTLTFMLLSSFHLPLSVKILSQWKRRSDFFNGVKECCRQRTKGALFSLIRSCWWIKFRVLCYRSRIRTFASTKSLLQTRLKHFSAFLQNLLGRILLVSMAGPVNNCLCTQLIDENSEFNEVGARNFVENVNLAQRQTDYSIVSIMGPQSSGKSTLLNHLFGTNFTVMNANKGRSQSTKGIWLAESPTLGPQYLVIDIEGTDGEERGDDTTFEKRSALFALAVSDIVILNMWCNGVGLVHATCQPLLKTVFQVMMQLFTRSKINLIFVLRDKTETSLDKLKALLQRNIQQIWDDTAKPQALANNSLDDHFNIEVVALSHYRYEKEEFMNEVHDLRQQVEGYCTSGEPNTDWTPGSAFVDKAIMIWDKIKENKDLDLPSINEMVAMIRCDKIFNDQYQSFLKDEIWCQIEEGVRSCVVRGFGEQVNDVIATYLSLYDVEVLYYDETVRNQKRNQLKEAMLQVVKPSYQSMLEHIRVAAVQSFHEAFENELNNSRSFSDVARECTRIFSTRLDDQLKDSFIQLSNWNYATNLWEELLQQINDYVDEVRATRVDNILKQQKDVLADELEGPVDIQLREANDTTWPEIRTHLENKTESAKHRLLNALFDMELDEGVKHDLVQELENHGRNFVRHKASGAANTRLIISCMKERFHELFSLDSNGTPRVWEDEAEIEVAAKAARPSLVKMLSVLAAIRIRDHNDAIEETLSHAIHDDITLNSTNWEQVPQEDTLLSPSSCRLLWDDFLIETAQILNQASEQVNQRRREKYFKVAVALLAALATSGGAAVAAVGGTGASTVASTTVARTVLTAFASLLFRRHV